MDRIHGKIGQYLGEKQIEDLEEVDEPEEHIREPLRKVYHSSCRTTDRKTKVQKASAIARVQRLMKDGKVQQIGTLQGRNGTYTRHTSRNTTGANGRTIPGDRQT